MSENKYSNSINLFKKIKPKFSFHYIAYTVLISLWLFSLINLVSATTPNPGHPWSEVGDGVFTFTSGQTATNYTYTFPAANTTVLTTNAAVTVAQGGTGLTSIALGSVLAANSANTLTAVTSTSGTKVLTNTAGVITWETSSGGGMVYPSAGIANSTGSAWGTSYTTTGSGTVLALQTSPNFSTSIITPYVIGGTGTTSDLYLQTTSGVGADGADIHFLVGSNGGTEAMTILNNGSVGIGVTGPTAMLHLKAGTATAKTAPLKFTSGTALTTPEDGAMEYHSSHLYFTIGSTRYQLDQQSGGGGGALSGITAATGDATINSGNNAITWNWALTTAAKTAFTFGENTASTNGVGNQSIVDIKNLSGSTASPLRVISNSTSDIQFSLNNEGDFVVYDKNSIQTFKVDSRSFTQIGTGAGSASPALLVLDTGNISSDPSGANGGMYYNSNLNQFRCYRNSTWENCGQYQDYTNYSSRYGTSSLPPLPSSGELRLFTRSVAGRMLPAFVGPAGLDSSLQPFIARNSVAFFRAYPGATTVTAMGMALSAVGTATAKGALATTNIYTSTAGLELLVTTAATTAVAGFRVGTSTATMPYWRGNASGMGGFTVISRFGPATGTTLSTDRMFVGMQSGTSAPTDVNPSTLTNIIGVGYDSADTNWQIMFNDGSGTATKVDTGITAPTADRTNLYEVAIFCAPNSSSVTVQFTNLTPGGSTYSSTNSADLPSNTTFLGIRGYHSVGGTSSVVGFGLASIYSETDT